MLKRLTKVRGLAGEVFLDKNNNCFWDFWGLCPVKCENGHLDTTLQYENGFQEHELFCVKCNGVGLSLE
jgi:hypothetical protein